MTTQLINIRSGVWTQANWSPNPRMWYSEYSNLIFYLTVTEPCEFCVIQVYYNILRKALSSPQPVETTVFIEQISRTANSHLIHHLISQVFCMLFKASKDSRCDWKRWTIALKKKRRIGQGRPVNNDHIYLRQGPRGGLTFQLPTFFFSNKGGENFWDVS